MNNIFIDDFQDFLKEFEDFHVEYVLVGGYSVIIHGYNRTTGDMDLFVNATPENYQKIVSAFNKFGMSLFDMTRRNFLDTQNFDVFEFGRPPIAIDIMTKMKGLTFDETLEQCIRYQINTNLSINVIHINQLIQAKLSAARAKDIADIEYLNRKML